MKLCPRCGGKHTKKGTFCSRSCANARTWTEADRKKKSESLKASPKFKNALANLTGPQTKESRLKHRLSCARANRCPIKRMKVSATLRSEDTAAKRAYRTMCKFRFRLSDYPKEFDMELIKKYGFYRTHPKHDQNLDGVSRDHLLSVKDGFAYGILPIWVAHPANCRLLLHYDNRKKSGASQITPEELWALIARWEAKYGRYYGGAYSGLW